MAATLGLACLATNSIISPAQGMGSLSVEALDPKSWDQESSFQPVFGSERGRKETRIRRVDRLALVENTGRDVTGRHKLGVPVVEMSDRPCIC